MTTPAFTSSCTNVFGTLNAECRKRLEAVLRNPTERTWDDAYSLIIRGSDMLTLWQAWIAVDPSAPRRGPSTDLLGQRLSGWERVPDQFTLYRAVRYATDSRT